MCGIAISDSLMPEASAPIDAHRLSECGEKGQKAADVLQQFALQEGGCREDDEGGDQWIGGLENAERIGGPLRCEEIPLLRRELPRPHRERARGRVRHAQLSDSGDQLQHEAADLALQVEIFVLVIEAYPADAR